MPGQILNSDPDPPEGWHMGCAIPVVSIARQAGTGSSGFLNAVISSLRSVLLFLYRPAIQRMSRRRTSAQTINASQRSSLINLLIGLVKSGSPGFGSSPRYPRGDSGNRVRLAGPVSGADETGNLRGPPTVGRNCSGSSPIRTNRMQADILDSVIERDGAVATIAHKELVYQLVELYRKMPIDLRCVVLWYESRPRAAFAGLDAVIVPGLLCREKGSVLNSEECFPGFRESSMLVNQNELDVSMLAHHAAYRRAPNRPLI